MAQALRAKGFPAVFESSERGTGHPPAANGLTPFGAPGPGSIHRFQPRDPRNVVLQVAFDAGPERHGARGASDAGAVEANLDRSIRKEIDELDVAAVGLHRGANQFEHAFDAGPHVFGMSGG